MRSASLVHRILFAAVALAFAVVVGAQDLPKLPADKVLPQTGDSPGKVTFSHATHVAVQAKPDCTTCHPKLAPIVKTARTKTEPITHARMDKGQTCGACHNGKAAHGFDDCSSCHKQ